jgi:DnaJ-class molecular chaperone
MSESSQDNNTGEVTPPPCPKCEGTGLSANRKRHCSECLGSGKQEKRQSGWQ